MKYDDENLLMISALQHILFCERQCALIHVEQIWCENVFTVKGEIMHEKAHSGEVEYRDGMRIERGIPLRSLELGLVGRADVVEFHRQPDSSLLPFPVEYKLGKPKENRCDEVQLCAQAICLEEMMDVTLTSGALFYGRTRKRHDVVFECELRSITADAAMRLHRIVDNGITPLPDYNRKKCDACSLKEFCIPKIPAKPATSFMEKIIDEETS